jgi:PAS domain S-box-containing protein
MRVSCKVARQLFEAAEAVGVRREDLVGPLGFDAAALADPRKSTDWETLAALLAQLSARLDGSVERLRAVGRELARVPSHTVLQRLARSVVSVRGLYVAGARWLAPVNFPSFALDLSFPAEDQIRLRGALPAHEVGSAPFLHVCEGMLSEVPTLLGLPRARILQSEVTPRNLEILLAVPSAPSGLARLGRRARALVFSGDALELLESQRQELAVGLESTQRDAVELHTLLDELPDLVIIHREGTLLWVNRMAVQALGYGRTEELVGKPVLHIVAPLSRELVASRMAGNHDGRVLGLTETALLTEDGRSLLVEVSPPQIVSYGRRPARLLLGRDITERARLQQRLIAADRMASIGILAAGVAHEVNNPLAYVLNNIELAMKFLAPLGEPAAESRAVLGVALEGVDRIRVIVRDLLMLTRGDERETLGNVDVRAVVESTMALAAREIEAHARLVCEYEVVPLARGTSARLGQVLLNLLGNALEAMAGRPKEENELRLAVRGAPSGGVFVEVSDNGVGIAPENAVRVFDPFFTTKAQGRGTGLGLSISQRLIAEIGGDLTFVSTHERGSTFRVTLAPAVVEPPS